MSVGVSPDLRYRLSVAGRVVLAACGGYVVAALSAALLALVLPLSRAEAATTGTLLSFAILAAAVIWVFAARTLGRAAVPLALAAGCLTAALWFVGALTSAGAA
jgi:hypothetical protein